jgi:hypothetical protein
MVHGSRFTVRGSQGSGMRPNPGLYYTAPLGHLAQFIILSDFTDYIIVYAIYSSMMASCPEAEQIHRGINALVYCGIVVMRIVGGLMRLLFACHSETIVNIFQWIGRADTQVRPYGTVNQNISIIFRALPYGSTITFCGVAFFFFPNNPP